MIPTADKCREVLERADELREAVWDYLHHVDPESVKERVYEAGRAYDRARGRDVR